MTTRPLLLVILTALGVYHAVRASLWFGWLLGTSAMLGAGVTESSLLKELVPLVAAILLLWKRRALAARIDGPADADTEPSRISRNALMSSALGVLGLALVLDSLYALAPQTLLVLTRSPSLDSSAEIHIVVGSSVRIAIGALLLFLHPVVANVLAPLQAE